MQPDQQATVTSKKQVKPYYQPFPSTSVFHTTKAA